MNQIVWEQDGISGSVRTMEPTLRVQWVQDQPNVSWVGPSLLLGAIFWIIVLCSFL